MGKSSRGDGSPKPKSKHSKKKSKHSSKDKEKKSKHKRRKEESSSSPSEDSSSDSGAELLSPKEQLKRERQAVTILRDLLYTHGQARKDFRELLWTVDQGKVANLAGVPDEALRAQLKQLLKLLGLRKASGKASYVLPPGHATTLSVLGFVFDETPRPPQAKPAAAGAAPAPARPKQGPAGPPSPPQQQQQQPQQQRADKQEDTEGLKDQQDQAQRSTASPSRSSHEDDRQGQHGRPDGTSEGEASEDAARAAGPRRLGPAMPTPEMLAAAAEAAAAGPVSDVGEGGEEGLLGEEEEEEDVIVGPVPPELQDEVDAAPQDAREAEVQRIMRLVREAAAAAAAGPGRPGTGAGSDAPPLNAYEVLGVSAETPAAEVKKRYMRVSLLIHPDKCNHKDAHEAFQAVARAAKVLQDSGARLQLDAAREDAELRRMAAAAAAQMEQERAWRVARGEEPAAGAPGAPAAPGAAIVREAWMTELPPERQAGLGGILNQVSQRAFSKGGSKPRGDTSAWTDTPQQRAARAAAGGPLLEQAGPARLTGPIGPGVGGSTPADARVMDAYNSQKRKKSLLELHQERQQQGEHAAAKAAKKAKTSGGAHPDGLPWKPFNREDLELKPTKTVDPAALLKNAAMGNKFSSAGGSRHFL